MGRRSTRSGPSLYERFGRLDVLVGNAAILGRLSPLPHIPSEHWERVIDRQRHRQLAADPHARSAAPPLGCRARDLRHLAAWRSHGRAYWAPYSVSKAALEALAKTYANETSDSAIKVNLIDPGATATRMRAEAYPGEDQTTLRTPEEVAESFIARMPTGPRLGKLGVTYGVGLRASAPWSQLTGTCKVSKVSVPTALSVVSTMPS